MLRTPILFIIFNRFDTTKKVFERIKEAKPKQLFIAGDGPRIDKIDDPEKCQATRKIIEQIDWDCEVKTLFREKNLGCKIAVSSAISWFFDNVEEGIILEDDCLPHPTFFKFCENLLEKYRYDQRVMMITGSNFQKENKYGDGSYYFSRFAHIWGWASWRRAWQFYDVDLKNLDQFISQNKIDEVVINYPQLKSKWLNDLKKTKSGFINTWDYQWSYAIFSNFGLSVTPNVNLISNIGFGHQDATFTTGSDPNVENLPTFPIGDITHPSFTMPSKEADDYIANNIYFYKNISMIKKNRLKRLKKNLLRILKNKIL
jgi:hypothetical protein